MVQALFPGSEAFSHRRPQLPSPNTRALSQLRSVPLIPGTYLQASAGGQGLEEGKLSWEVVAVGVLARALHPAALGLLVLLGLLLAPAAAQARGASHARAGCPCGRCLHPLCLPLPHPSGNSGARPRAPPHPSLPLLIPPTLVAPPSFLIPSWSLLIPHLLLSPPLFSHTPLPLLTPTTLLALCTPQSVLRPLTSPTGPASPSCQPLPQPPHLLLCPLLPGEPACVWGSGPSGRGLYLQSSA